MLSSLLSLALGSGVVFAAESAANVAAKTTAAKPDLARATQVAENVCAACHGADGNSMITANPKLAAQHPEYLYKQLVNFKPQGAKPAERNNAVMAGMVASLSDADMRGLAAYYAQQKIKLGVAKDKKTVELGQKLWRAGDASRGIPACAACHGPAGAGIPSQYPRLQGQHAEYTEAQLKLFRAGERANDSASMMRTIAVKLTDPEMRAVSDYIAGLR